MESINLTVDEADLFSCKHIKSQKGLLQKSVFQFACSPLTEESDKCQACIDRRKKEEGLT